MRYASLFCLAALLVLAAPALAADCEITLGTSPEPPDCVPNPGGETTMFWSIEYDTTPDFVYYAIFDPDELLVEEEVYPNDTGVNMSRIWTVPEGFPQGPYTVRIDYWSVEVGLEGRAEVIFLVCSTTPVESETWGRIKGLFRE